MNASQSIPVFERNGLRLTLSLVPDPAAVDLLCNTQWGSQGGTRYLHLDTRTRIKELPSATFMHLHKDASLLGVLAMSLREVQLAGETLPAWYIRYFAMQASFQQKGEIKEAKANDVRESILKRTAKAFFDHPEDLVKLNHVDRGVFYAYVTLDNDRSRGMCEMMGFVTLRTFKTFVFSRVFPRQHPRVRKVAEIEQDFVRSKIRTAYAGHGFVPQNLEWLGDDYWISTEYGAPVAGLRVTPVHWKMSDMPGFNGKVLMKWLPRIPLINRLINPEKFDFLAVDAIFCGVGYEHRVYDILSHACSIHKMNNALIWMDEQDTNWKRIEKGGSLGILNKLNHASAISVIAKGLIEGQIEKARKQPAYIWAGDVI